MNTEINKQRIYWQCRRGMWELDLLLIPFFQAEFDGLSVDGQHCFQALLTATDTELHAWLNQRGEPENHAWQAMLQRIRDYALAHPASQGQPL